MVNNTSTDALRQMKEDGTGLGLYLTRKLVTEMLHGEIEVESEAGKGSIFKLKIPKKPVDKNVVS